MLRLPRLIILEIISREGSSSMSEGFLEFIRMLNSISFKELKGNKSIAHILQKNTSLLGFKCLQSSMVRPLHLPWIHRWQIPHLTACDDCMTAKLASNQLCLTYIDMTNL